MTNLRTFSCDSGTFRPSTPLVYFETANSANANGDLHYIFITPALSDQEHRPRRQLLEQQGAFSAQEVRVGHLTALGLHPLAGNARALSRTYPFG